jgi:hypothetical protein
MIYSLSLSIAFVLQSFAPYTCVTCSCGAYIFHKTIMQDDHAYDLIRPIAEWELEGARCVNISASHDKS